MNTFKMSSSEVTRIHLTQDDIEEIETMTDPQEIKDYLTMVILSQLDSSPLEAMSPICTNHEVLH